MKIGDVAMRDEPFLAGQHPAPVAARRRRAHAARVGTGALLGDGEAIKALAAAARQQVARALRRRAVLQRDRGLPRRAPNAAGRLAELLVDQHLLEQAEPLPAVLARMVDRVEPGGENLAVDRRENRLRQVAVLLDRHLVREELRLGEFAGPLLQGAIGLREVKIHGSASSGRSGFGEDRARRIPDPQWLRRRVVGHLLGAFPMKRSRPASPRAARRHRSPIPPPARRAAAPLPPASRSEAPAPRRAAAACRDGSAPSAPRRSGHAR